MTLIYVCFLLYVLVGAVGFFTDLLIKDDPLGAYNAWQIAGIFILTLLFGGVILAVMLVLGIPWLVGFIGAVTVRRFKQGWNKGIGVMA